MSIIANAMTNETQDPQYLVFVRRVNCLSCGRLPSEAHHAGRRGKGQKASDGSAVALCWACHKLLHDIGRETFAKRYGLTVEVMIERTRQTVARMQPKYPLPPIDRPEAEIAAPFSSTRIRAGA